MSRRLLFVHTTQGDHLTGGPRTILTMLLGLRGGPFEPCLVTQCESDLTQALTAGGVAVRILPLPKGLDVFGGELTRPSPLRALHALAGAMAYDRAFGALLREMRPEAVWTTNLRTHLTVARACRRAHVPLVWNIWLGQPSKGFVRFLNDAGISAAARIVTEYEGQAAELFRKDQLVRALPKVRTVHSGHTAPVPLARPLRSPNDPFLVGTLGVISARKDQRTFVEMAAEVAREVPNARFVIGGDALSGESWRRDEVRKLAFRLGLADRFELAGWITEPFPFLARLDVYVQTSRAEGLPGAVREAMAMRLPVVATNVGGTKAAVVPWVSGFLAAPGDAPALASAVIRIAQDPALAQGLGEAGRRRFERSFSSDAFVARMHDFFEELTSGRESVSAPRALPLAPSTTPPSQRPVHAPASAPHRTS